MPIRFKISESKIQPLSISLSQYQLNIHVWCYGAVVQATTTKPRVVFDPPPSALRDMLPLQSPHIHKWFTQRKDTAAAGNCPGWNEFSAEGSLASHVKITKTLHNKHFHGTSIRISFLLHTFFIQAIKHHQTKHCRV